MKGFYTRLAGPKLRDILESLGERGMHEKLSLEGELDVARAMSERAMKLFDSSQESDDIQTRALGAAALRQALEFVVETASKASRVRKESESTVDLEALDFVLSQLTIILDEELGDQQEALKREILARLEAIKLPNRSEEAAKATASDIRHMLDAMKRTVPTREAS